MAVAVGLGAHGLTGTLAGAGAAGAGALGLLIAGGAGVFVVSAQLMGAIDTAALWHALRRGGDRLPAA